MLCSVLYVLCDVCVCVAVGVAVVVVVYIRVAICGGTCTYNVCEVVVGFQFCK